MLDIYGEIAKLKVWVDERIQRKVAAIVWFAPIAKTSSSGGASGGQEDAVEGHDTSDDRQSYQFSARRLEPFGFRSRPISGVLAGMVKAVGGAANGMIVGISTAKYGPADLKEGEFAVYCKAAGLLIKGDETGKLTMSAAKDRNVEISVSGSGVIQVGGAGAMPLWPTFRSDLSTYITLLHTVLAAGTSGTAAAQTLTQMAQLTASPFKAALGDANKYDSKIAGNG